MAKPPSPLIALADLDLLGPKAVGLIKAAHEGGIEWVLLRAKKSPRKEALKAAREILAACPRLFTSLHGSESEREEVGAGGVHFPSGRLASFRGGAPQYVVAGVSCHLVEEILGAFEDGADYVFLSQLFAPLSKPPHEKILGPEGFAKIAKSAPLPVYALGGLDEGNMATAKRAGASGAAISGALFFSGDVKEKASRLVGEAKRVF